MLRKIQNPPTMQGTNHFISTASKAVSTPLELWSSLDFPHLKPAMRTRALVVVALLIGSTPVDARGHVVYTGVVAVAVVWR